MLGTEVEKNIKLDKVLISRSCLQEATEGMSQSNQKCVVAVTWDESREERAQGMQEGCVEEAALKLLI